MEDLSGSESEIRTLRTLMCCYCYLQETNEDNHYGFDFTTITKEEFDSFRLNPECWTVLHILYQLQLQHYFDLHVPETSDPIPVASEVETSNPSLSVSSFEREAVHHKDEEEHVPVRNSDAKTSDLSSLSQKLNISSTSRE